MVHVSQNSEVSRSIKMQTQVQSKNAKIKSFYNKWGPPLIHNWFLSILHEMRGGLHTHMSAHPPLANKSLFFTFSGFTRVSSFWHVSLTLIYPHSLYKYKVMFPYYSKLDSHQTSAKITSKQSNRVRSSKPFPYHFCIETPSLNFLKANQTKRTVQTKLTWAPLIHQNPPLQLFPAR